jgi:hypothetical protein
MGLKAVLREFNIDAVNRRDDEQARVFVGTLSDLDAMQPPKVLADPATVAGFASDWRGKLR